VVFDFADPGNYHEVNLTAAGNAQLRSRIGGMSSTVATATFAAPGANKWIHITLIRSSGRSTVRIDGVPVFANVLQDSLPEGDVGLIARNTRARFDDLDAKNFGLQDPYIEDFNDGNANLWQPLNGTWSATSNTYRNSAVVATAITKSPLHDMWQVGEQVFLPSYTFKVRMLNPYGASGNLVGIAWVKDAANYTEAVFSPTGRARLNSVSNGVRTTIASATYLGGDQNRWFEVEVGHNGDEKEFNPVGYIKVNGVPVFDIAPNLFAGTLSLITHWSPARFDDVRAAENFFTPFLENFDSGPFPIVNPGSWTISDGTMNNSTIIAASRATFQSFGVWRDLADSELRARMINRFGASGNLVGFTYGARGPVYYEAVFSPTGVAHLRKVVRDVPIPIATAQYEGGEPGQWFDAQLIQIGDRTTVKVNGATVFDNLPQPDAVGGGLGFVAHWTNASIDDVSFTRVPATRYRVTPLENLANPFGPLSFVNALNDRAEAVGTSRGASSQLTAVLWRSNGRVLQLGASNGSDASGINNKSEVVGISAQRAFIWQNGVLRDLGVSPETTFPESGATDINERGEIAGNSCGLFAGCPALFWQPDGTIVPLQGIHGDRDFGEAFAINDAGAVVGESGGGVLWQGGAVELLDGVTPIDINNRGQIAGFAIVGPNGAQEQRGVLWQLGEMSPLRVLPGLPQSQARGINEHTVVVGWNTRPGALPEEDAHAVIWQEGSVTDLNDRIACGTLPAATLLTSAEDINERGQMAVRGIDKAANVISDLRAFVLTPVSPQEPCD
jgi:probable HAF family extracellular repeat protein